MPNIWEIYTGNAKKFTIGTETAFALGISRSFKASLNNDVKLSIGTEIKGGLTAGMKLGNEIEFNFGKWQSHKYEISWQGPHDKEVKAGKSNFYNEDQFRATAGELGAATPLNVAKNILTTKLQFAVGTGMILQFAATILASTAAFYATREKVENRHGFDKDIQYDDKSVYAGSMYEAMIDGFAFIAAVSSWGLAKVLDGQKRKRPIRDKFFLNMDRNRGILLGAHNPAGGLAEDGPGAWHELNADGISFGLNNDMMFSDAQTLLAGGAANPLWVTQSLRSNGMMINGNSLTILAGHPGAKRIKNKAKDFMVSIGNDNDDSDETRIHINAARSLFVRPGSAALGLELTDNAVKLGVTDAIDLAMTNNLVRLRKGDNFLQFENDEAVLSAQSVNIRGNVNINGSNFSVTPASVKIGDMVCLLQPDPQAAAEQAQSFAQILAQTAKVQAEIASERVATQLRSVQETLERSLLEAKKQSEELQGQLAEMERLMKQAALNA